MAEGVVRILCDILRPSRCPTRTVDILVKQYSKKPIEMSMSNLPLVSCISVCWVERRAPVQIVLIWIGLHMVFPANWIRLCLFCDFLCLPILVRRFGWRTGVLSLCNYLLTYVLTHPLAILPAPVSGSSTCRIGTVHSTTMHISLYVSCIHIHISYYTCIFSYTTYPPSEFVDVNMLWSMH